MRDEGNLKRVRRIIRTWLERQIESTKGTMLTVNSRMFFFWLGKNPYVGAPSVLFWRLVEELAPQLGLKPLKVFSVRRKYRRKRMVFVIESRTCIQPQSNLE